MNKKAFYTLSLVIFTSAMGNNIIAPFIAVYATTMGANASGLRLALRPLQPETTHDYRACPLHAFIPLLYPGD
jgi:hypothetical protein